jgi:hypothetical protein
MALAFVVKEEKKQRQQGAKVLVVSFFSSIGLEKKIRTMTS